MKKCAALSLIPLALLLLAACTRTVPPAVTPEASAPPPASAPISAPAFAPDPSAPEDAVIEYGDINTIDEDNGPMRTYICFPQANAPTDQAISQWANSLYAGGLAELRAAQKTDPAASGEINVQFNSYLVDDKYAGVMETGIYSLSGRANASGVVRTFNIDVQRGILLSNANILDPAQTDSVLTLLKQAILDAHPEAAGYLSDLSPGWLENLVIGHDGIQVILNSGVCLPSSLGTLSFTLSYAALGSAQLLFPQAQTAAPAPTVSETPAHEISAPFSNAGIDPHQPMLALTFDDGPSKNTDHILDLLEQNGAHATFCVLGDLVGSGREAVLRAYTLGDEVIGHSWDHKDLTKLSYDQIASELSKTSAKLESVLGVAPPALFRPPYGAVNGAMKTVARDLGYAMIYWSVDTLDWKTKNTDAIYAAVMSGASDGAIILCHDRVGETADAMERAIPDLIAQGYQLVTVSELIENSGKAFEAGTVYYSGG